MNITASWGVVGNGLLACTATFPSGEAYTLGAGDFGIMLNNDGSQLTSHGMLRPYMPTVAPAAAFVACLHSVQQILIQDPSVDLGLPSGQEGSLPFSDATYPRWRLAKGQPVFLAVVMNYARPVVSATDGALLSLNFSFIPSPEACNGDGLPQPDLHITGLSLQRQVGEGDDCSPLFAAGDLVHLSSLLLVSPASLNATLAGVDITCRDCAAGA
jgi:hypothetical protein